MSMIQVNKTEQPPMSIRDNFLANVQAIACTGTLQCA
jgi:hypothetical protein